MSKKIIALLITAAMFLPISVSAAKPEKTSDTDNAAVVSQANEKTEKQEKEEKAEKPEKPAKPEKAEKTEDQDDDHDDHDDPEDSDDDRDDPKDSDDDHENAERPIKPEVSAKPAATERPAKPEATVKPEVSAKPVATEGPAKPEATVKPEKPERTEKPVNSEADERPAKPEAPEVTARPERPQRPEVSENPDRGDITLDELAGILDERRQELTDSEIGVREYFSSVKELLRDARSRETKDIILAEIAEIKRAIEDEEIEVFIRGDEVDFSRYDNVKPYIKNDVTLIPLRAVAEALDAEVEWDEETQTITITTDTIEIIMQIGNSEALVNGESKELTAVPELNGGRTMVPLRFIMESLNSSVEWDEDSRTVIVE